MPLNLAIAPSLRRNGWCEFSARLLSQRPHTSLDAYIFHCCRVGAQTVGHNGLRPAVALHRALQERQGCLAIPAFRGKHLQHLAFVINSPPEIVRLAIDPNEHLVQVPTPARIRLVLNAPLADRRGEHRTEPVPPEPYRFVADTDPPLEQQIF